MKKFSFIKPGEVRTRFAPYEEPEIVLTIMFENVEGVQTIALPAAKEILEYYFSK